MTGKHVFRAAKLAPLYCIQCGMHQYHPNHKVKKNKKSLGLNRKKWRIYG